MFNLVEHFIPETYGKYSDNQTERLFIYIEKVGFTLGFFEANYMISEQKLFEGNPTDDEVLQFLDSALAFQIDGREIAMKTIFEEEGI